MELALVRGIGSHLCAITFVRDLSSILKDIMKVDFDFAQAIVTTKNISYARSNEIGFISDLLRSTKTSKAIETVDFRTIDLEFYLQN